MKPPPQLLSFDCYGTLVDWRGGMRQALETLTGEDRVSVPFEDLLARYMVREVEVEETYRPYREVLEVTLGLALEDLGVRAGARARGIFAATIGSWPPFPETARTLQALRAAGKRIAILSNVDDDMIARSVAAIGVPFDFIVTAQSIRSYKPAPKHWERLLAVSGLTKAEVLHVGASLLHDIEPASALGFETVWIDRLAETPGTVAPDHRLEDLRALPELVRRMC